MKIKLLYLIAIFSTFLVPLLANEAPDPDSGPEATPTPNWDQRAHVPPDDPWDPPAAPPQYPTPTPTPRE